MNLFQGSQNTNVGQLNALHVQGNVNQHIVVSAYEKSLYELLNPIKDASHTRDRKRSPPNSACLVDTRTEVIEGIEI
ncbi:hypothetical protein H1R20_g13123, partial [Candolleomyces eurysporus]